MYKIIIDNDGELIGTQMLKDDVVLDWNVISREEQIKILNTIAKSYNLFLKFFKENQYDTDD